MGTCAAFMQYPSPCSQRAPEIQTAQAACGVRSEIPGQRRFFSLRPGLSHRDLSRCPICACLRSLAWNAGTGGRAGCTLPPCGPCAASLRQCHHGRCNSQRWRWEAGARRAAHWRRCGRVVNEWGGMAPRMDMGMGRWRDSCSVCCASRGVVLVAQQAKVCSGDGRGRRGSWRRARGGDHGGMDHGNARCTCCALRRCCASYFRCRAGAGFERRIVRR
jgi:hypothetical protein